MTSSSAQRDTMSGYYAWQSRIYDLTRWAFLFGRDAILDELDLKPGQTVLEIGCGTGRNIEKIVRRIGASGKVIAVDCAQPMLVRCAKRIEKRGWRNVRLVDREYGAAPITHHGADAVLMSYSLSMMPGWEQVLECASRELKEGGRIGVVDFCLGDGATAIRGFESWMTRNHVAIRRPYVAKLSSLFQPVHAVTRRAFGKLWSYYLFVGQRP